MTLCETELQMARRHVREGKRVVAEQRKMVQYLDGRGHPTEQARDLLTLFESTLEMHHEHLVRVADKLGQAI